MNPDFPGSKTILFLSSIMGGGGSGPRTAEFKAWLHHSASCSAIGRLLYLSVPQFPVCKIEMTVLMA